MVFHSLLVWTKQCSQTKKFSQKRDILAFSIKICLNSRNSFLETLSTAGAKYLACCKVYYMNGAKPILSPTKIFFKLTRNEVLKWSTTPLWVQNSMNEEKSFPIFLIYSMIAKVRFSLLEVKMPIKSWWWKESKK